MTPSVEDFGRLLFFVSIPFVLLFAVVAVAYAAGFHAQTLQPKLWLRGMLAAALASAFSLGLYGYSYTGSDYQAAQLPLIQRLADPAAYPRDAYVDTAAEFPAAGARLAAKLVREGRSLERAARDLHVAALALTCLAFLFLAYALFNDQAGALLSLALFVISYPLHIASPLAYEVLGKDHFDVSEGMWPLVLFTLALWAPGHTAVASALAGALCWLHPLLGALLLAAIAATAAAECFLDPRQHPLSHLAPALAPGIAVSLPFWALHGGGGDLLRGGASLAQSLRLWYPLAAFAGSWSLPHWLFAAGIVALAAQTVWRSRAYEEYQHRFPALLLGLAALWAMALLVGGWLPLRPLLLLQSFRTDSLLLVLALAAAGHQIRKYLGSARAQTWSAGALLLLAWAGRPTPLYLLSVAALWALWESANEREFESYGPWLWRGCQAVGGALGVWGLASLLAPGGSWALGPDRALGTVLAVALGGLGSWRPALLPAWAKKAVSALILLLAFLPALRVAAWRAQQRTLTTLSERERDAQSLAATLAEMSGPAERFLVPPGEKFRVLLGRPVVFEWNDGVAMQWAPGFDALWRQGVAEFRVDETAMREFWKAQDRRIAGASAPEGIAPPEAAYRALTPKDLAALADKHEAAYVIAYADQPLKSRYFTEVAAGKHFKAYQYLFNYSQK